MSKFRASVGRVILAERVVKAFKKDKHFENDEEEPPELVDIKVCNKELLKSAVTARRWLFMDARKELIKRKEEKKPKNLRELLKLVFLTIRRATRRQELKRRVVNVFWEALANKKPAELPKPKTVLPTISKTPSPPLEQKTVLDLDFTTTSVIAGKLDAIKEARAWITESTFQWKETQEEPEDLQNHMARMEALSESSQSNLEDLYKLKHKIEISLTSAKAVQQNMAHLMSRPWLDADNNEKGEGETKHKNEEEDKEEALVEEPEKLSESASSTYPLDMGSNCRDSIFVSEAASEDNSSRGLQQPVQLPTPRGRRSARASTRDSSKLDVPKKSRWEKLRVVHKTTHAIRAASKNSTASAPEVLESTEHAVEAIRKKNLEELAAVESLWNELTGSCSSTSAGDMSSGREDSSSPGDEDNAPPVTPAAEQSRAPLILVTQPDDLSHDGVDMADPTFLVQPPAESDEQQAHTKEPTIGIVQHGGPTIAGVAEESKSVTLPSCSSPIERQASRSGARKSTKISSTRCLEVPSGAKCSRSSSKTAPTPWMPGARSSSKTPSCHPEEAPRRSSSKMASSNTEEAPRKSSTKMASIHAAERPQRSVSKTASSRSREEAAWRSSSKRSTTSFTDVNAVESPENRPDSLTEVVRHGDRRFSASRTSVRRPTPLIGERDALPLVVGTRPSSPWASGTDLSTSADPSGEAEHALHPRVSGHTSTPSSCSREMRNWRLSSPDSVKDGSASDMHVSSCPSSRKNPETWTIVGATTSSQTLGTGGLTARDMSPAPLGGSVGELYGSGRASSKTVMEKKANCMNIPCSNRIRRATVVAVSCSSYRLGPDADCSGLFVAGAELTGG